MERRVALAALIASVAWWSGVVSGCTGSRPLTPSDGDAGRRADGAIPARDAGIAPGRDAGGGGGGGDAGGDPATCVYDTDCNLGTICSYDYCYEGTCGHNPTPDCTACSTDAECDDGVARTHDSCYVALHACVHADCMSDVECDDGDPCTSDSCAMVGLEGVCQSEPTGLCCTTADTCNDFDSCTVDSCTSGMCDFSPIPGCGSTSCRDFDGDGHGTMYCYPTPGDDCDDFDAARHPGATESCTDGIDNDCDGMIDRVDDACGPTNTTCATAAPLTSGVRADGSVISRADAGSMTCGADAFYTLTLTATSDVDVTVNLHDFAAAPPACPGCPPPEGPREIWYNVYLESTCGDVTTDVGGSTPGSCYTWSPSGGGWGGSRTRTLSLRRVPAGSYTVHVAAKEFFGWMTRAIDFDVTATTTASAAPACATAPALVEGVTVTGTTTGASDAFGLDCSGAAVSAPEALHYFDLTERRRVRLEAVVPVTPTVTYPAPVQVGIYDACDAGAASSVCVASSGGTCAPGGSVETVLGPGRHWVVTQAARGGAIDYELTLRTEAEGAACAGATPITTSGALMGTTAGASDEFRWNDVCGEGAGPDVVYALSITVPTRVVLDLVASYTDEQLTLVRGCGDAVVAGRRGASHVDVTLEPGTYHAIVGGTTATAAGSYVLNATLLAT